MVLNQERREGVLLKDGGWKVGSCYERGRGIYGTFARTEVFDIILFTMFYLNKLCEDEGNDSGHI